MFLSASGLTSQFVQRFSLLSHLLCMSDLVAYEATPDDVHPVPDFRDNWIPEGGRACTVLSLLHAVPRDRATA